MTAAVTTVITPILTGCFHPHPWERIEHYWTSGCPQSTEHTKPGPPSLRVKRRSQHYHWAGRLERALLHWVKRQIDSEVPSDVKTGVYGGVVGSFASQVIKSSQQPYEIDYLLLSPLHKWENRDSERTSNLPRPPGWWSQKWKPRLLSVPSQESCFLMIEETSRSSFANWH